MYPLMRHSLRVAVSGAALSLGSLTGCNLIEYSPNQTHVPAAERHLTAQNIARLAQQPKSPDDTLRFVFIGDSQRFYDEAEDFVKSVNQQPDIDFVVVAGDISDFGLVREMRWMHHRLQKLKVPYFTVIGNHDQVGNGRQIYQNVYGPLNYSFTYAGTKFICVDTNSREYAFNGHVPDLPWLSSQLADTAKSQRQLILCHVPPTDGDFDPNLTAAYGSLVGSSPQVTLHLAGHVHRYSATHPFKDGVPYLTAYSFQQRRYNIVSVWGRNQFNIDTISYASPTPQS